MHTILAITFALLLTSPLQALLVDDSGYALSTTVRDGYYYFARCRFDAEAVPRLSACRALNANDGLRPQDFTVLQQRLQTKVERAKHSATQLQRVEWALLAVTGVSALLMLRKLHQAKVVQILKDTCDHHCHHLWQRLSALLPRVDVAAGWRFFAREQQWRVPTLLAQVLAIVVAGQQRRVNLDRKTLYEFLQTEVLQLSVVQGDTIIINVRSVTAIEFMLYEIIRLRQGNLETQAAHR